MSKDRRKMKMVRYEDDKYILYEFEYERSYEGGHGTRFKLDFNYLATLLKCPVTSKSKIGYLISFN